MALAIIPTLPIAAITGNLAGIAQLHTPDPREVAQLVAGGNAAIQIDLGSVQTFDTVFIGHTSASSAAVLQSSINSANAAVAAAPSRQSRRPIAVRHFLRVLAAPVQSRFVSISGAGLPAGLTIGTAAVGLSFQPKWSQEWGAGRSVGDTGSRERLRGGGFAFEDGVSFTGWSWTLGDLLDDEVDELYEIARECRQTRTLLVVEDISQTAGLNERIHWGTFDRLEAFERRDTGKTRWAFRVDDWA